MIGKIQSGLDQSPNIIGDFTRYTIVLFSLFFIMGVIYGLINTFSFVSLILNPIIYALGVSLIIIVISYDINEILDIVGFAKEPSLSSHIKYSKDVQEISMLMSMSRYETALTKVDKLLSKDPEFVIAHNLRGEVLTRGFKRYKEARKNFNIVLKLSKPGDEQYRTAEALKASTYSN